MRDDIKAQMDNLAFHMKATADALRNDPGQDAVFCSRIISQAQATIDMRLGEQYGMKMVPQELVIVEEPLPTITSGDQELTPVAKSTATTKPKNSGKNS